MACRSLLWRSRRILTSCHPLLGCGGLCEHLALLVDLRLEVAFFGDLQLYLLLHLFYVLVFPFLVFHDPLVPGLQSLHHGLGDFAHRFRFECAIPDLIQVFLLLPVNSFLTGFGWPLIEVALDVARSCSDFLLSTLD